MIVYKEPLQMMAQHGWSTYRLVREKVMGNGTIDRLRKGESVSTETINTICKLCGVQPGDILEYRKDGE